VRKQYYFRPSSRGLLAWDVDRLVQLSSNLPRKQIPLSEIRELDEVWFGEDEPPTWRAMLEHMTLIEEADLSFPIILSSSGAVMDGMHRVAKAAWQGRNEIEAVQFDEDPEPPIQTAHRGRRRSCSAQRTDTSMPARCRPWRSRPAPATSLPAWMAGYGCAQFSKRRPTTLPNSRSLFETRISFRPTACAAISVSNGPMGLPARSSFARTLAYDAASLEVNSTSVSGRRKFSTRRMVFTGAELLAAPVRSSASVMTLTATSARLRESMRSSTAVLCFS